jgi:hypothetical protein
MSASLQIRRRIVDEAHAHAACRRSKKEEGAAEIPIVLDHDFKLTLELHVFCYRRSAEQGIGGETLGARRDTNDRHNYPEQGTAIDSAISLHVDPPAAQARNQFGACQSRIGSIRRHKLLQIVNTRPGGSSSDP